MATNKDLLDAIEKLTKAVEDASGQAYLQQATTNEWLAKIFADTPSRHDY